MQRAEQVKQVFRRCKAARNLAPEGGLTHVLVPDDPSNNPRTCTSWRRIDDPDDLMRTLQNRNRQHFGQPRTLTQPPLDFTMKFTATCLVADAILERTFLQPTTQQDLHRLHDDSMEETHAIHVGHNPVEDNIEHLDDSNTDTQDNPGHQPLHIQQHEVHNLTQLLLACLQYISPPDVISASISKEEYKGKLKAWDESTSTSPTTNMHLGHLRAYWAEHTYLEDSDDAQKL